MGFGTSRGEGSNHHPSGYLVFIAAGWVVLLGKSLIGGLGYLLPPELGFTMGMLGGV